MATGDLGYVDATGFVHIHGRLKNVQINAFGRNFSPEWPESEAMACPAVRRVVILATDLNVTSRWLMPSTDNRSRLVSNYWRYPRACPTMRSFIVFVHFRDFIPRYANGQWSPA
jgi:long-subunit acyl-CoA synthetase (AMP-forming)